MTFKKQLFKKARLLIDDRRTRALTSLYGGLMWNGIYAVFLLCLGGYHGSFWFFSLAVYYLLLGGMRLALARQLRGGEEESTERGARLRFLACGLVLLLMAIALALIVFFMVYWQRSFHHHQITAIAIATYTFVSFTVATVNAVKCRKWESLTGKAYAAVGLVSAAVSMLMLTTTLLTAFEDGSMTATARALMVGLVGAAVSLFTLIVALGMLVLGAKELRETQHGTQK